MKELCHMKFRSQGARRRIHLLLVAEHLPRQFITMKYATSITCATLLAVAAAAPVSHTRPILPRTEEASDNNVVDVLPSGLTDLTTAITDAIPLDVSVSAPVLPEDKHAARAILVDLGGAGVNIKRAPTEEPSDNNNIVDVLPNSLTDLTNAITDALPLDVSVSAPVLPEDRHAARAISVDLGGAGATLRRAPAEDSPEARAISVDLGGAGATL
jgi:hypothetical protein